MGKFNILKSFIYKWRYLIGYAVVAISVISALVFAGMYIPGGLSAQEMQSTIISSSINFTNFWSIAIINLPYHLLQHASIALFGVSILSIKLPSIILAFFSVIGLVFLLRQWFNPSLGVLATLIAVTTGQFLFIAQNGTPDILYLFWPVWLMYFASIIPITVKFRKLFIVVFFTFAALSLYTPLSFYILIVIAGAIILHPHLRYLTKQLSKLEFAIGGVVILAIISPLVLAITKSPNLGLTLIGWPSKLPNIPANLSSLGHQYFGFANPGSTTVLTPFFELGSMLLVVLGIYYVYQTRVTAKNYVVSLWTLCLVPIVILNPSLTSVTFLPLVLLLATGLNGLLAHWYELFPRNPYARIGGLIPIIILVIALVLSGLNRYIYGYIYNPDLARGFSQDLRLIPKGAKNLIVGSDEVAFYQIVAKYNKQIRVSTSPIGSSIVATRQAKQLFPGYAIRQIITSSSLNNADRFYVYNKITN